MTPPGPLTPPSLDAMLLSQKLLDVVPVADVPGSPNSAGDPDVNLTSGTSVPESPVESLSLLWCVGRLLPTLWAHLPFLSSEPAHSGGQRPQPSRHTWQSLNQFNSSLVFLCMVFVLSCQARPSSALPVGGIVNVDGASGDDTRCLPAPQGPPCKTIARGLQIAPLQATVVVGAGTYRGPGNCNLTVARPVTLVSAAGRDKTVVDCEHQSRCLVVLVNATVEGFTFRAGFAAPIANCTDVGDASGDASGPSTGAGDSVHAHTWPNSRLRRSNARWKPSGSFVRFPGPDSAKRPKTNTETTIVVGRSGFPTSTKHSGSPRPSRTDFNLQAVNGSTGFLALLTLGPEGVTHLGFQDAGEAQLDSALLDLAVGEFAALKAAVGRCASLVEERMRQPETPLARTSSSAPGWLDRDVDVNVTGAPAVPKPATASQLVSGALLTHKPSQARDGAVGMQKTLPRHWKRDGRLVLAGPHRGHRRHLCAASSPPQLFNVSEVSARAGGCVLVAGQALAVEIRDVTIMNGVAPWGGGLAAINVTRLVLANASITGNSGEWGGGLLTVGGTVWLDSSLVSNNSVTNRGPVVTWPTNAAFGGGVALFGVTVAMTNSSILGNRGTACGGCNASSCPKAMGGGLSAHSGHISLSSSDVSSNFLTCTGQVCVSEGGGIFSRSGGNLSVSSSYVTNNSLTCSGNLCQSYGGGISSYSGTVSVSSSHVTSNYLTSEYRSYGGGVYSSAGIVSVSSSHVTSNYLTSSEDNSYGGGICTTGGNLSVSFSHVTSNYLIGFSAYGGGLYAYESIVSVLSSDLTNNSVSAHTLSQGGGIWSCCGVVLGLEDVWLEGNHLVGANVEGGGLWIANSSAQTLFGSSSVVAKNTFVRYNNIQAQSKGSGGGFYAVGFSDQLHVSVHFFGCEVSGNVVGAVAPGGRASGGAGEIVDTALIMQHCHVASNHATSVDDSQALGGGLAILGDKGAARVSDCSFTRNTGGDGGGLYIGASFHAARTFIGHNNASGQGGGVFLSQNASFVFSGNTSHNCADHLGGTLFSAQESSGRASLRMQGHALVEDGWAVVLPTLPNSSLMLEQFSPECLPGSMINVTMQQASRLTANVSIDKGNFPTYLSVKPIFSIVTVAAVQCSPCQNGSYNLKGESHFPTGTDVAPSGAAPASFVCHPCPYGGDCSRGGAGIVAQGGFWGRRNAQDGSVTFGPCPVGYCCAGSCKQFDQCAGHRTGRLCGACKQGTGEAWFSTQCKPTSQCMGTDASLRWFIPVLLVVLAAYTGYFLHSSTEPRASSGLIQIGIFFYQVVGYLHSDVEWEQSRAATLSFIQSSFLGGAFGGGSKSPGVCLVPGMSAVATATFPRHGA